MNISINPDYKTGMILFWSKIKVSQIAPGIAQIKMSREDLDSMIDQGIACCLEMDVEAGKVRPQ